MWRFLSRTFFSAGLFNTIIGDFFGTLNVFKMITFHAEKSFYHNKDAVAVLYFCHCHQSAAKMHRVTPVIMLVFVCDNPAEDYSFVFNCLNIDLYTVIFIQIQQQTASA